MRELRSLSAEKILAISEPELLFSCSASEAKREYKALASYWHPDLQNSSQALAVFRHLVGLYGSASVKLRNGSWNEPVDKVEQEITGVKRFRPLSGSVKSVQCLSATPFELGCLFIGDDTVTFELPAEHSDLAREGLHNIQTLRFANMHMAAEISQYLPQIVDYFPTQHSHVVVVRKTPDQLRLADVLKHGSSTVPAAEHAGWIVNALLNVACYFEWSNISHNALSPDTVFVSPLRHAVMVLGGWWYATSANASLLALPEWSANVAPPQVLDTGLADPRTDLECIKAIGRSLLGNTLPASDALDRLSAWLNQPAGPSALEEYADWKYSVLASAFGSPRFIDWNLSASDLYKEK